MKNKNKVIAAISFSMMACLSVRADHNLVTNVYEMVNAVYEEPGQTPYSNFIAIRGGGFRFEGLSDRFLSLCTFVSNRNDEIVAEWPLYETNEVARFTLISAIGFSGFSNMTNLANKVLTLCENDHNSISQETLRMVECPYGTSDEMENYLGLKIDVPGVSNLVQRLRSIAVENSRTNAVEFLDECLSGERKCWYLDMKAAGAL